MRPDWHGAVLPLDPPAASPPPPLSVSAAAPREADACAAGQAPRDPAGDDAWRRAVDAARPTALAPADPHRRAPTSDDDATAGKLAADRPAPKARTPLPSRPSAGSSRSSARDSPSTASTDQVVTPPASDSSAGLDAAAPGDAAARASRVKCHSLALEDACRAARRGVDLLHLSAVAVTQDRMVPDEAGGSRKRMADGAVKLPSASTSPAKGHSRTTSAISVASTAGSNIGEVSAELKTLLSYAMVKVNHGWQSRSLDEVESLASRAASPTSNSSAAYRHHDSSASPRQGPAPATVQIQLAHDAVLSRHKSVSPPSLVSPDKPALASPAPIQPCVILSGGPGPNPRRSSTPRCTPVLLSHQSSLSPHTPGPASRPEASQALISRAEQDVAETLLFMNSPGNSANLKHVRPAALTPGAQAMLLPRNARVRHALPGAPRKALPSQRPAAKKAETMTSRPGSPADLDSPRPMHNSPRRATPKRWANGTSSHVRAALSLSSGLGLGRGVPRRTLHEEDIERMLDRAGNELPDTSDDEEIQLPHGRRGVTAATGTP